VVGWIAKDEPVAGHVEEGLKRRWDWWKIFSRDGSRDFDTEAGIVHDRAGIVMTHDVPATGRLRLGRSAPMNRIQLPVSRIEAIRVCEEVRVERIEEFKRGTRQLYKSTHMDSFRTKVNPRNFEIDALVEFAINPECFRPDIKTLTSPNHAVFSEIANLG
jgi:hypothetical protein